MKAAILVQSKAPLIVAEVVPPDELLAGQVFVKIDYSGICGAQINEIDAMKGPDKFLPHLLGIVAYSVGLYPSLLQQILKCLHILNNLISHILILKEYHEMV